MGCFGVGYGLALQGLGKAARRPIWCPARSFWTAPFRQKKPWALAAAARCSWACTISYFSFWRALNSVDEDKFREAEAAAAAVVQECQGYKSKFDEERKVFDTIDQTGRNLTYGIEGRLLWLEALKAINECLPRDVAPSAAPGKEVTPADIEKRNELHIVSVECRWTDKLQDWFKGVQPWYQASSERTADIGAPPVAPAGGPGVSPVKPVPGVSPLAPAGGPGVSPLKPVPGASPVVPAGGTGVSPVRGGPGISPPVPGGAPDTGPTGPGFVITLVGHHYHNAEGGDFGAEFVEKTLIDSLQNTTVVLPSGEGGKPQAVTLRELGITYPVLVNPGKIEEGSVVNPNVEGAGGQGAGAAAGGQSMKVRVFHFRVEMAWKQTPPSQRSKNRAAPSPPGVRP